MTLTKSAPIDVSVILCAYSQERLNDLLQAVESIKQQTYSPKEVLIVIDHNPGLFERVRSIYPEFNVLENCGSRGLSGARNSGIEIANGDVLAFLDDDAVAEPDWLEKLVGCYSDENVLGVGGAIEPNWQENRPDWFPEEFDWVVGCTYKGLPAPGARVRNLIGCNMSFRKKVFDEVGGFRSSLGRVEALPAGCEETEFCIRLNQSFPRGVLLYEPAARVLHRVPNQRAKWRYFRSRCYSEGISKALVSSFVGAKDGLSSERTYTFQTLPRGVAAGAAQFFHGDVAGLLRSGAILAGLLITGLGYLKGILLNRLQNISVAKPQTKLAEK